MKKLLLLILLLQVGIFVSAQSRTKVKNSRTKAKTNVYIGLNSTNMLKNLLSFNSNATADPYTLVGIIPMKKGALRLGLGLVLEKSQKDESVVVDNSYSNVAFRIGYQWKKSLWKSFSFSYGMDILGGYEEDHSVRENFYNKDKTWSAGLGPILGLHYEVNDRLSLSTESSLYYTFYDRSTIFGVTNGGEDTTHSQKYSLRHLLPNALYVYFRL